MVDTPIQQIAFIGEWTWINATVPPPANAQMRFNNGGQNKATAIWVNNISYNGIDATSWLMEMIPGYVIRVQNKDAPAQSQTFAITGAPVAQSGYVELSTTWLAGGQNLQSPVQSLLSVISCVVRPTGNAVMARVGNPVTHSAASVPVTAPGMEAMTSDISITGQLMTFDYFHPFQGLHLTSPGLTIRQWYAGQALMGFIASRAPAANLVGKVSEYAFKVADSMIAYEAKQSAGITSPAVPRPPSPAAAAPPQSAPATVTEAQVMALRKKDAEAA